MADFNPFDFGDDQTQETGVTSNEQQSQQGLESASVNYETPQAEPQVIQEDVNDNNSTKDVPASNEPTQGVSVNIKRPGESTNIQIQDGPEKKDNDENQIVEQKEESMPEQDSTDQPSQNKEDEKQEDPQDELFGQKSQVQTVPAPESAVDEHQYNLLQQKYQEHLTQVQQEIQSAVDGLLKLGTEYRDNYKKQTLQQIEESNKKQQEEWDEIQKILQNNETSSWDKIGKLTQAGTGRAYEVLRARVALAQKASNQQKEEK